MTTTPLSLLVLSSNTLIGAGLYEALHSQKGWQVECVSPRTDMWLIEERTKTQRPDVTIIDAISYNDVLSVFDVIGRENRKQLGRILVLSPKRITEERYLQYMKWGVSSCIFASSTPEDLINCITSALAGHVLFTEEACLHQEKTFSVTELLARPSISVPPSDCPLSAREVEVLQLISYGATNKLIAQRLRITDNTVKNHITSILKKLNKFDRTVAVTVALQKGWIHFPGEDQYTNYAECITAA